MTTPEERVRSLRFARELLESMLSSEQWPNLPEELRREARVTLRHYPRASELQLLHLALPAFYGRETNEPGMPLDPAECLSLTELAKQLGVTAEAIHVREEAGELFSLTRPGRRQERAFPAFQAWEGIQGEPLKHVLEALGRSDGLQAYAFFTTPSDLLDGLNPLQALLGLSGGRNGRAIQEFMRRQPAERLATVVAAAGAYAADLDA